MLAGFYLQVILLWSLVINYSFALDYICTNRNNKPAYVSQSTAHTGNYYPHTLVPQDDNIPITLGVNNYLYRETEEEIKEKLEDNDSDDDDDDDGSKKLGKSVNRNSLSLEDQLSLVYHEIDVKVIDTYFDDLYIAYPARIASTKTIFQSRYRDNYENLFRIRYSTFANESCLGSNLIQFKMIFKKDKDLYQYFFGNCNSTEIFYDDFDENSFCIPINFYCFNSDADEKDDKCMKSNYNLALDQAVLSNLSLVNNNELSVEGSFPSTALSCLDNKPCLFSNFKTFDFSKASYTPVIIDSIFSTDVSSSSSIDSTNVLTNSKESFSDSKTGTFTLSFLLTSADNVSSDNASRTYTSLSSLLLIFLYTLGL